MKRKYSEVDLILFGMALASPGREWLKTWSEIQGHTDADESMLNSKVADACYQRNMDVIRNSLTRFGVPSTSTDPVAKFVEIACHNMAREVIRRRTFVAKHQGIGAGDSLRALADVCDQFRDRLERLKESRVAT